MTQVEYDNFRKLSEADKYTAVRGMTPQEMMEVMDKTVGADEYLCCQCQHWKETSDCYGICQNTNSQFFNSSTNAADGCYGDPEKEEIMRIISEVTVEQIRTR